ncbi:MAG: glycosyltransferase [Ignavibacteriaceae bacterium]|nr:glycosyltransferase [Ignavibacteriaceae bacterium]
MDLSIIIVNYNVKEFLQNLLTSLFKAVANLTSEIIIVDNGSDDGSVEMLRDKFPQITLIANKENLGFSKANNLGLKIAKGKFLLLLNPDTIVQEDTFEKLIKFFNQQQDAGMTGCKILNPDGTLQLACRRSFPGPWTSFCKVSGLSALFPNSRLFARYNLTFMDENQSYEVDAISGSFMMVRREVFEKIGGLDEQFFMYGEDLDWCYRVQKSGWRVYYVHETTIIHYKGESTKRSSLDETKFFYHAMHLFVKKHFASSLLVEIILRLAIIFRQLLAFLGKQKLPIAALLLDFVFFNLSLFLTEKLYSQFRTWRGFPESTHLIVYTIPALVQILVSASSGAYKKEALPVLRIFPALLSGFFVISSLTYFFKDFAYSRGVVLLTFILLVFILSGWRIIFRLIFKIGLPQVDKTIVKTLVVGTTKSSLEIAKKLKEKPSSYHAIIGLISETRKEIGEHFGVFEVIGSLQNIQKVIREKKISVVIFPSEEVSYTAMMSVVADCQKENVEFKLAGSNLDFLVGKSSVYLLEDIPFIEITYNISQTGHRFIKRSFDLLVGLFLLFTLYPVFFLKRNLLKRKSLMMDFILEIPKVVGGRFSFVGPKENMASNLFLGKKGITGIWFTDSENEENLEKLNIFYAKNQNIWLDLEILSKTFFLLKARRK